MTLIAETAVETHPRTPARIVPWTFALGVAAATAFVLLTAAPIVSFVMHGGFSDPDDAMRMAEVRAWMGGQPWFDMTAMRLDPPSGIEMHWSRLVDVPNAALIRLFGLFVEPGRAEAIDRIVLPTLCLVALYAGMARLATLLLGRSARGAAILGTLLSGATLTQFQPGRIGHHAFETVALIFAVGATLSSLDRPRARDAGFAGVLVAFSLAMSLETMPLLGALCLGLVLAWVWRGMELAPSLLWFGAGLGLTLPFLFFATVPPAQWLSPVPDTLGIGHVGAGLIGALGAVALAIASPHLRVAPARFAAAGLVGLCVLLFLLIVAPYVLRSPFAGVDPLVRSVWLDNVVESKPLALFMRTQPMLGLAVAVPVCLGTIACFVAAATLRGTPALRFAGLGLLSLAGFGLGLWQLRAFASVTPLAMCGGLFAVSRLRATLRARGLALVAAFAPMAILPFTSTAWAMALPDDPQTAPGSPRCLEPAAIAPLAALPPGRAVAPLDAGAHLIEATALDVFAAPYHRDNDGNRFVLDIWRAPPEPARLLLEKRMVRYVLVCPGMGDVSRIAGLAPDGLAARLLAGHVPPFLKSIPVAGTPYRVFAVQNPNHP